MSVQNDPISGNSNYWPDDDDRRLYIPTAMGRSFHDLLKLAREKWGEDLDLDALYAQPVKIHTKRINRAPTSTDFTYFLLITYDKGKPK